MPVRYRYQIVLQNGFKPLFAIGVSSIKHLRGAEIMLPNSAMQTLATISAATNRDPIFPIKIVFMIVEYLGFQAIA